VLLHVTSRRCRPVVVAGLLGHCDGQKLSDTRVVILSRCQKAAAVVHSR